MVIAPSSDHLLLTAVEAALRSEATRAAFVEREMVLYRVVAGTGSREQQSLSARQTRALLSALGVTADSPATAFLIGKDGGIKLTEISSLSLDEVFALIYQMPMRRP